MARYVRGMLLGGLVAAMAGGCSFLGEEDDDDDEDATGTGGGPIDLAPASGGGGPGPASGGAADPGAGAAANGSTMPACTELAGLADCGFQAQEAQLIETNILLVMDKSGSMNNVPGGYPTSKWEALKPRWGSP